MILDNTTYAKTTDYGRFKSIVGNRKLKEAHVANLVRAFDADAIAIQYNPVTINEKWEVIDGQHRIAALKKLQLPVYYLMQPGLTLENVIALNSGKKAWTPEDFAHSWIERGNKEYETYLWFKDSYGINHDILLRYLSLESPLTSQMFKDGKLKVVDFDRSVKLCEDLISLRPYYNRWNNRSFALGFWNLWSHPAYDHKRMLHKINLNQDKVSDRGTPEQYADMLSDIYNHGVREDNRTWFAKQ